MPRIARDSLSSLVRIFPSAGSRQVSVWCAVRRAGTLLDPAKFRRGERVDLVAIVRTLQRRTAVPAVRSYVSRR